MTTISLKKAKALKPKENLRDNYINGNISVEEYVNSLLLGRDADRERQNLEKKYNKLTKK